MSASPVVSAAWTHRPPHLSPAPSTPDAANQAGQSINAPLPLPTCDGKPTWDPFEAGGGPESSAPSPGFSLH